MGIVDIERLPYTDRDKSYLIKFVDLLSGVPDINAIILFGSYARMEQRIQSDFDIMAITASMLPRELRGELCSEFEELGADLIFYTENQWKTSDCKLVQQIKKDGVMLWSR